MAKKQTKATKTALVKAESIYNKNSNEAVALRESVSAIFNPCNAVSFREKEALIETSQSFNNRMNLAAYRAFYDIYIMYMKAQNATAEELKQEGNEELANTAKIIADYKDFEDYAKKKWGFAVTQTWNIIKAAVLIRPDGNGLILRNYGVKPYTFGHLVRLAECKWITLKVGRRTEFKTAELIEKCYDENGNAIRDKKGAYTYKTMLEPVKDENGETMKDENGAELMQPVIGYEVQNLAEMNIINGDINRDKLKTVVKKYYNADEVEDEDEDEDEETTDTTDEETTDTTDEETTDTTDSTDGEKEAGARAAWLIGWLEDNDDDKAQKLAGMLKEYFNIK